MSVSPTDVPSLALVGLMLAACSGASPDAASASGEPPDNLPSAGTRIVVIDGEHCLVLPNQPKPVCGISEETFRHSSTCYKLTRRDGTTRVRYGC